METTLPALIHSFVDRQVVVLGEAMLDSYLMGRANRLCQEAPVPVVTLSDRRDVPGGAANVAVNLRSLGAQVSFLSVVGDDENGDRLRQALTHRGVTTDDLCVQTARQTLVKQRIIAAGQMVVRLDQGSTEAIAPAMEQQLIDRLNKLVPSCDAIVISDYSYGLLTPRVMDAIASLQAHAPKLLVVDSKRLASYRSLKATLAKPNYEEACRLVAEQSITSVSDTENRIDFITRHGEQLLHLTGASMVIVTLDAEGAVLLQRQQSPQRIQAKPTLCKQAAGAGDTFISALTLALASHAPVAIAAELAVTAAAVVVAKEGTETCSLEELQTLVGDTSMVHEMLAATLVWNNGSNSDPSPQEVA